jgi:hypothetical protein
MYKYIKAKDKATKFKNDVYQYYGLFEADIEDYLDKTALKDVKQTIEEATEVYKKL